jgi:hypothetical protein
VGGGEVIRARAATRSQYVGILQQARGKGALKGCGCLSVLFNKRSHSAGSRAARQQATWLTERSGPTRATVVAAAAKRCPPVSRVTQASRWVKSVPKKESWRRYRDDVPASMPSSTSSELRCVGMNMWVEVRDVCVIACVWRGCRCVSSVGTRGGMGCGLQTARGESTQE